MSIVEQLMQRHLGQWRAGIVPASGPKFICLQRFEQLFHRPHVNTVFGTEGARAVVDEYAADQVWQVVNGA